MPTRVGIELSPLACRIVEIERGGLTNRRTVVDTRISSFALLPRMGGDTRDKLAALARREVAAVVWGLRADHRQVVVTQGPYERMRQEAIDVSRDAGVDVRGMVADIAATGKRVKGTNRRPVVLALAGGHDLTTVLQPLTEAGIHVRSLTTPALALMSLARLRPSQASAEAIEAYVALEETSTAIALIRAGVLLAAREFSWGFLDEREVSRSRDDIAIRIAEELETFFEACGLGRGSVSQIYICGGLPELRSMTVPVMERLDVEVETLDSLFGIDAARLPEPADEFRERSTELRLAWAVAADWHAPINLLSDRQVLEKRTTLVRAAAVAAVPLAIGGGWLLYQSPWFKSPPPIVARLNPPPQGALDSRGRSAPAVRGTGVGTERPTEARTTPTAANPAARSASPVVTQPPRSATPPPLVSITPPARVPPPAPATTPPAVVRSAPPVVTPSAPATRPTPSLSTPPPKATPPVSVVTPPPAAASPTPAPSAPPPSRPTAPPVVTAPPVARATPSTPPAAARPTSPPTATPPSPTVRTTPSPSAPTIAPSTSSAPAAVTRTPPATASPRVEPPPTRSITPAPRAEPPTTPTPSPARIEPPAPTAVPPAPRVEPRAPASRAESPRLADIPPALRQRPTTRPEPAPLPFDAALGTILYAPDRKLAIVDNRIVQIGDDVRGARVVDITPTAVLLRDSQGRLRRLSLGMPGR